jgi:uncharacterized protein YydD (DUF2326 family)
MVKLKRIFSEPLLFDEVKFKDGINIIQGKYSKTISERGINGVGKSTLIRLIDFALLSDNTNDYFDLNKLDFLKDISVILEINAWQKTFFIKRSFDFPKRPKFGEDISNLISFDIEELRRILGGIFFGNFEYDGVFDNLWFRNLIHFFLKDDLVHFERKDPMKFPDSHFGKFETYKYNFFLMGISNSSLNNYIESIEQKNNLVSMKNSILSNLSHEDGKTIEKITSEIQIIDINIKKLEDSLEDYTFLRNYEDIERDLIRITSMISEELRKLNVLEKKIGEYTESHKIDIEIDKERIIQLYSSVQKTFGDIVKKNIEQTISFRKNLAENRKNFIRDKEKSLEEEIINVKEKISKFETERAKLYKLLNEKEAFDSIKNSYSRLVEEKAKRERLITYTVQNDEINKKINENNLKITKNIQKIAVDISNSKSKINDITKIFFELVSEILFLEKPEDAIFSFQTDTRMNSPLNITIDIPKEKSLGNSRMRILIYDLTVFLNLIINDWKLPHFLVHDGVFHAIEPKKIIKTLNLIYSKSLQYPNFQYIITVNDGELPQDKEFGEFKFDINKCVITTYTDSPESMIFKREFE